MGHCGSSTCLAAGEADSSLKPFWYGYSRGIGSQARTISPAGATPAAAVTRHGGLKTLGQDIGRLLVQRGLLDGLGGFPVMFFQCGAVLPRPAARFQLGIAEEKIADAGRHETPLAVNGAAIEAAFLHPLLEFLGGETCDGVLQSALRRPVWSRGKHFLMRSSRSRFELESLPLRIGQFGGAEGSGQQPCGFLELALGFQSAGSRENLLRSSARQRLQGRCGILRRRGPFCGDGLPAKERECNGNQEHQRQWFHGIQSGREGKKGSSGYRCKRSVWLV